MAHLHLNMTNETRVFRADGAIVRTSKNLRGMRDYARVSPVAKVQTEKDPNNAHRGLLRVTYVDGCYSIASFASHGIMIDWVRNRRSWRGAEFIHKDRDFGYLTKPGQIAGA